MALGIKRNLGPVSHLEAQEYTVETATGRAAVCCPLCETITEVAPPYTTAIGGAVSPIWICPKCPFAEWIVLCSVDEDPLE